MADKPLTPDHSAWDSVRDAAPNLAGGASGSNPHRSKTFVMGRNEHFAMGLGSAAPGAKWARLTPRGN